MFCTNCGTKNKDSAEFCKKCGSQLNKDILKYAGFWIRFGAYFIDFIGVLITAFFIGIILGLINMPSLVTDTGIFFGYFCWILYSTFFLAIWSTTPGKALYGLKVMKEDEEDLDFKSSLIRALLQPLSLLFFGAGYWNMDKSEKKQSWHDKSAHTIVISKKEKGYILQVILTIAGLILYFYLSSLTTTQ